MSSIRTDLVALDTNEFIFAVHRDPIRPSSSLLVSQRLAEMEILVPLQVLVELHHNLSAADLKEVFTILNAANAQFDFSTAPKDIAVQFRMQGARESDAQLAAQLYSSGVRWLISENRHFLTEIPSLPFNVVSAESALRLLAE